MDIIREVQAAWAVYDALRHAHAQILDHGADHISETTLAGMVHHAAVHFAELLAQYDTTAERALGQCRLCDLLHPLTEVTP